MITDKLVKKIVESARKSISPIYKSVVIIVGASLFLIIIPLLLLMASYGIEEYILSHRFRILQIIVALLSIAFGFFQLVWSFWSLAKTGKGLRFLYLLLKN